MNLPVMVMVASSAAELLLPRPAQVEVRGGFADAAVLAKTEISVADVGAPAGKSEESYRLEISSDRVRIIAPTAKGERYAKVTLEQLKALSGKDGVPACTITDWPELQWRGLLLDCGRNYAELPLILDIIDFLARYKLNVFHWHLSDVHGWRLESKKYPQLQSPQAFTRQTGRYYSQAEFKYVVDYAAERGVLVVPELDVPGHSGAFRRAFGFEKMHTPGAEKIVCELIDELCSLEPAEKMPVVHLGTDEVREEAEKVPDEWYDLWARRVTANGRTVMGWWPGHVLNTPGKVIQETWYETRPPTGPYVDGTCYYIDSFDPAGLLAQAAFKRPCPYPVDPAFRLGGEIQAWHDDAIATSGDLVRDNPLFPAIALFSDSYWRDRATNRTDLIFRPPSPDRGEFAALQDLERRVLAQRDRTFRGFNHPFHFVAQTHMRWRLEDENGNMIAENIPSGIVYVRSPRLEWGYPGYVDSPTGTVTLVGRFDSPRAREAGAIIDLNAFHRSGAHAGGIPAQGEWNRHGARVRLNGEEVNPPRWNHDGGKILAKEDIPWTDESGWLRPATPIRIRRGANEVRITLPKKDGVWYWSATFIPVQGTREHPRELRELNWR